MHECEPRTNGRIIRNARRLATTRFKMKTCAPAHGKRVQATARRKGDKVGEVIPAKYGRKIYGCIKNKCRSSNEVKSLIAQDAQEKSSKKAGKDKVDKKDQRGKDEILAEYLEEFFPVKRAKMNR